MKHYQLKLTILFLSLLAGIGVFFAVSTFTVSIEEELLEFQDEINRNTPLLIDSVTQLDSVMAQGRTLLVKFTILNDEIEITSAIKAKLTKQLRNHWCTTPSTFNVLSKGISFHGNYYSTEGKYLFEIKVTVSDCS